MQNLKDDWYCKKEYRDKNGDWHTSISDYMSKEEAETYCNKWNANHNTSDGDCSLCYGSDFNIEEMEEK